MHTKYDSEYVNRLYRMVKGNCSLPFTFYCITDDPTNVNEEIEIIHIDHSLELESWWWKILLFGDVLPDDCITLYFDLEVVIQNNINDIITKIQDDKINTLSLEDSGSTALVDELKYPTLINSSILGFISGQHKVIYNKFMENIDHYMVDFVGMDRFITRYFYDRLSFLSFPDDWYFRHFNTKSLQHYIDDYGTLDIKHSKVCILKQIHTLREPYARLEEYFL